MNARNRIRRTAAALVAIGVCGGCTEDVADPLPVSEGAAALVGGAPAPPAGLVGVSFGSQSLDLWPFAGTDLAGSASDPVNLLFAGRVDVLSLRAALLELDGDRTAFGMPDAFPFNCRWTDANGGVQTAYTDREGWAGNPVQLECGGYDPLRFHLRLFPAGDWVVGAAHFDLLIPGTPEHQVISWELARQIVVVDFLRSGRLDGVAPLALTQVIGPVPSFRDIPAVIYDGIPPMLQAAIGGPASSGGSAVPIPNTGTATILNVSNPAGVTEDETSSDFTLPFDQIIPRPFCSAGPLDYVHVSGEVRITTRVRVGNGNLSSHNTLAGDLVVTPFDILGGTPSGESFAAKVDNRYQTSVGPSGSSVDVIERIMGIPPSAGGQGSLFTQLNTAPSGAAQYSRNERC